MVQALAQEDPPEKEMATHYIIIAWEIPCTEETGRLLQSVGSQRVGRDLVTKQQQLGLGWQDDCWEEVQSDCKQLWGFFGGS